MYGIGLLLPHDLLARLGADDGGHRWKELRHVDERALVLGVAICHPVGTRRHTLGTLRRVDERALVLGVALCHPVT